MKPSVGRIVHYYQNSAEVPFAGIITEVYHDDNSVEEGLVNLYVFSPARPFYKVQVRFSKEPARDHWSWPPKV